jgi:hypothetical protein
MFCEKGGNPQSQSRDPCTSHPNSPMFIIPDSISGMALSQQPGEFLLGGSSFSMPAQYPLAARFADHDKKPGRQAEIIGGPDQGQIPIFPAGMPPRAGFSYFAGHRIVLSSRSAEIANGLFFELEQLPPHNLVFLGSGDRDLDLPSGAADEESDRIPIGAENNNLIPPASAFRRSSQTQHSFPP